MLVVDFLTFNAFQENTYILHDETKECLIIDPGMYTSEERDQLLEFLKRKELKPVRLINTHCHLDHIFGNNFVAQTFNLKLEIHPGEEEMLNAAPQVGQMYGIPTEANTASLSYLSENDKVEFGNTTLDILFTPGHSPASISFYDANSGNLIGGDVLFEGSIGRTDLPGGSMETLIHSIKTQFMTLPDETIVYSGHGNATTIGAERLTNPFLK